MGDGEAHLWRVRFLSKIFAGTASQQCLHCLLPALLTPPVTLILIFCSIYYHFLLRFTLSRVNCHFADMDSKVSLQTQTSHVTVCACLCSRICLFVCFVDHTLSTHGLQL